MAKNKTMQDPNGGRKLSSAQGVQVSVNGFLMVRKACLPAYSFLSPSVST